MSRDHVAKAWSPGAVAAGLLAFAGTAVAALPAPYRDGPPPGHTGGFGEPICTECHFDAPANDPAGTLVVDAPARYRPGRSYRIGIRLDRPGLAAGGFQLAVRFAGGERAGRPAGTLEAVDPRTAVVVDTATGVPYAQHTEAGLSPARPGSSSWTIRWTAPAEARDEAAEPGAPATTVVIHVAANAADDDASEFGDFIYTHTTPIPRH